jgi:hypothetical protein
MFALLFNAKFDIKIKKQHHNGTVCLCSFLLSNKAEKKTFDVLEAHWNYSNVAKNFMLVMP